ncbi:MAG: 50S ribosomal protein L10 [Candidatus Diapherotrites archaeon]
MTRHTKKWKHAELEELKQLAEKYPVIALADISSFPAALFQDTRKLLKPKAVIKVSKARVVKKALSESKVKGLGLDEMISGSIAVIFTELNPFELYAVLKKNKGSMSAKAGMIAPFDLIVPAGDTGLPPGPALSDLKQAGINARIQGATIMIPEDTVVCKKGAIVSKPAAGTLNKLNIKPIKVGLNLIGVLEGKQIFKAGVLDIDEAKVFGEFRQAHLNALNLALNSYYITGETVKHLLFKAFIDSLSLSLNAGIYNEETVNEFIKKADIEAKLLKEKIKE